MFDFLALLLGFILISFILLIVVIGVKFLYSLATIGQSNNIYTEETDKQLIEDSKEDSNGDGLILFDEPLFPEELDDEE
jgi:hypothetical protein